MATVNIKELLEKPLIFNIWKAIKDNNLSLSFYNSIFLSEYYKIQKVYLDSHYLLHLLSSFGKYLPSHQRNKIYFDSLLTDFIIIFNVKNNQEELKNLASFWSKTDKATDQHLQDTSTRDKILARSKNIFYVFDQKRPGAPSEIRQYIQSYIVIRQLLDDLNDYKEDLKNPNRITMPKTIGIKATQQALKEEKQRLLGLNVPLFYRKHAELYDKFF